MNTNILKIIVIVLLLTTSAHSCEKEENLCKSGNCITVDIKGSVRNMPAGEGIPDVPVEVRLVKSGTIFSPTTKAGSGKTDRNGVFEFKGTIDQSFGGTHISVKIPYQKDYINILNEEQFWNLDYATLNLTNLNFVFYNKAQLTINVNRTQTDEFDKFYLGHFFFDRYYPRWVMIEQDQKPSKILHIETAADVYTKIRWDKWKNGEQTSVNIDSLICRQNENNIININY